MKLKLFIKFYLIFYYYYEYTLSQIGAKLVVFFFRGRIVLLKYIKMTPKMHFFLSLDRKRPFLWCFVKFEIGIEKL